MSIRIIVLKTRSLTLEKKNILLRKELGLNYKKLFTAYLLFWFLVVAFRILEIYLYSKDILDTS